MATAVPTAVNLLSILLSLLKAWLFLRRRLLLLLRRRRRRRRRRNVYLREFARVLESQA